MICSEIFHVVPLRIMRIASGAERSSEAGEMVREFTYHHSFAAWEAPGLPNLEEMGRVQS